MTTPQATNPHGPATASSRTGATAGAPESGASTLARRTLVVDETLHAGGVIVFRGHDARGGAVRCVARVAVMRAPAPGEVWTVVGERQTHRKYGRQLWLTEAVLDRPSGRLFVQAVARHTTAFPGIGIALARRVWDAHGEGVFDLLDAGDPAPFAAQLGPELATILVEGWRSIDAEAKAYRWLSRYGFPPALAARVVAIYASLPVPPDHAAAAARMGAVAWHLSDDPYRMLAFAGWGKVDAAARLLGVGPEDERRLVGAAEAVCARRLADGHTWIPASDLRTAAAALLGLPVRHADRGIADAVARGALVASAGGYQAPGAHVMERFLETHWRDVRAGRNAPAQLRLEPTLTQPTVERLLDAFEAREGYALTTEQRAAVWMAVTEPMSLLLGGPGVGKTTVLKAVHHVAAAEHRTVHQAALAGRAAQRMAETTGRPASTIAALLVAVDKGTVTFDDEPLVVIDEASMCDLSTVYRLLRRFPPGVRLLLVGDPGQLPPIGFGLTFHVLADGVGYDAVPRTTLTRVLRQTEASGIPAVCAAVRRGAAPSLAAPAWSDAVADGGLPEGVSFVDAPAHGVTAAVIDILARLAPDGPVQVVGSVKPGPGGIMEINATLQRLRAVGKSQLNGRFFAGDPVLVTRNDYELGVMNGDLGVALENAPGGALRCRFGDDEKVLPPSTLEEADLAYAITCHKAQGSQFPSVVVPVTTSRLLDRTLLLTAISRAERRVVLVGDQAAFAAAVTAPPAPSRRLVGLGR